MQTISEAINLYLEHLSALNRTRQTLASKKSCLKQFTDWLEKRKIFSINNISEKVMDRYVVHVYKYKKTNDMASAAATQYGRISTVKLFFAFLAKQNIILYDVTKNIPLPSVPKNIPKAVLTVNEMERLIRKPDVNTALGLRDRAILETFYSTGIRNTELANLTLYDIDFNRGLLYVRQGKGMKDRVVPIGARALHWINKYIDEGRKKYLNVKNQSILFLSHTRSVLRKANVTKLVRSYIKKAGIDKPGGPHLLRHTMATHMLENGCDIRYIQEILGHASLSTTEKYTRVSIIQLKEVYRKYKPEV